MYMHFSMGKGDVGFINAVDVPPKVPYIFLYFFSTSKMEKVWLKEAYYNSDLNLDIVVFFCELPPLICLERLQLCMVIGLIWFKLQVHILHSIIVNKVIFG